MKPCSLCGTPLDGPIAACPRCGIDPRSVPAPRRPRRPALLSFSVALALLATGAVAHWRGLAACQPQSWADWHLAMSRQCLTPQYVCEHMTTAHLLDDPHLADAYRSAVSRGDPATARWLEQLVDRMRASYGCDTPSGDDAAAPALPPGHPAVRGTPSPEPQTPIFRPPVSLDT